jgi:hypothetical protein
MGESDSSDQRLVGTNFHALAVQFTTGDTQTTPPSSARSVDGGNASSVVEDEDLINGFRWADFSYDMNTFRGQTLDRICREANGSNNFNKIMRTLQLRLQSCKAAGCRGTAGSNCKRALYMLGALLLHGPDCVMSAALDFIPFLRYFLSVSHKHARSGKGASSNSNAATSSLHSLASTVGAQQAIDFMSLSPVVDLKMPARYVLDLLLDHKKLLLRRKYTCLLRQGAFPYLTAATSPQSSVTTVSKGRRTTQTNGKLELLEPAGIDGKRLLPFGMMHALMHPDSQLKLVPTLETGVLRLSARVTARPKDSDANETDDVDDAGSANGSVHDDSPVTSPQDTDSQAEAQAALLIDPFDDSDPFSVPSRGKSADLLPPTGAFAPSKTISPPTASKPAASTKAQQSMGLPVVLPPPPAGVVLPKKPSRGAAAVNLLDFGDIPTVSKSSVNGSSHKDLLDLLSAPDPFATTAVDPDSKFRVVNKDTGETMDVRMIVGAGAASHDAVDIATTDPFALPAVPAQPFLASHPAGAALLQGSTRHTPGKATDPFNNSTVNWASWGETVPSPAGAVNSDPFAFDIFGFNSPTKAAGKTSPADGSFNAFAPSAPTSTAGSFAPSAPGMGSVGFVPSAGATNRISSGGGMNPMGAAPMHVRQPPAQQSMMGQPMQAGVPGNNQAMFFSTNPQRAQQFQQQQQQQRDPFAGLK